jgi:hypothetical protein
VTSLAPRRISAVAEDCVTQAAELLQLLNRLSDGEAELSEDERSYQDLVTALFALKHAIQGIKTVASLEAGRYGL